MILLVNQSYRLNLLRLVLHLVIELCVWHWLILLWAGRRLILCNENFTASGVEINFASLHRDMTSHLLLGHFVSGLWLLGELWEASIKAIDLLHWIASMCCYYNIRIGLSTIEMGCFDGTVLSRIRLILIIIILHVLSRKAYVESFSFNRASSLLLS